MSEETKQEALEEEWVERQPKKADRIVPQEERVSEQIMASLDRVHRRMMV
ncbi:MAG: hypothetical protein KKB20_04615 [Proteobacteria bacterium]|nr:hypothetical protein [Pseudomonadota bacterium]